VYEAFDSLNLRRLGVAVFVSEGEFLNGDVVERVQRRFVSDHSGIVGERLERQHATLRADQPRGDGGVKAHVRADVEDRHLGTVEQAEGRLNARLSRPQHEARDRRTGVEAETLAPLCWITPSR
jgi:hypothetical protein